MIPIGPYTLAPPSSSLSRPCVPNHWMNEIALSSDGARIGVSAITRKKPRQGMQERVNAYAYMNANGTVTPVTTVAIHSVLTIDCRSAGVSKYCWNCSRPTNAPSLSCTLLTRIMKSGANRNSASAAQHATSSPCARRSCQ